MKKCSVSRVLGLSLSLLAGAVAAQNRLPEVIEWICVLESPRFDSVRCELSEPVPGYYVGAGNESPEFSRVRADLFRQGASAHVTRMLREAPQRYAGESWWIPLYTAPSNMARVRELTVAVMCGSEQDCLVHFTGRGFRAAALAVYR